MRGSTAQFRGCGGRLAVWQLLVTVVAQAAAAAGERASASMLQIGALHCFLMATERTVFSVQMCLLADHYIGVSVPDGVWESGQHEPCSCGGDWPSSQNFIQHCAWSACRLDAALYLRQLYSTTHPSAGRATLCCPGSGHGACVRAAIQRDCCVSRGQHFRPAGHTFALAQKRPTLDSHALPSVWRGRLCGIECASQRHVRFARQWFCALLGESNASIGRIMYDIQCMTTPKLLAGHLKLL
jgi:hypothetical protein